MCGAGSDEESRSVCSRKWGEWRKEPKCLGVSGADSGVEEEYYGV